MNKRQMLEKDLEILRDMLAILIRKVDIMLDDIKEVKDDGTAILD